MRLIAAATLAFVVAGLAPAAWAAQTQPAQHNGGHMVRACPRHEKLCHSKCIPAFRRCPR